MELRIKVKPESLVKNMYIRVVLKDSKEPIEAYFKKFMIKDKTIKDVKKQGQYRDSIEQITNEFKGIPTDEIYLFMTNNKSDVPV